MKFVIKPEHDVKVISHIIWGVCEFVDGVFETEDKDIAEKLISLGYAPESDEEEPENDAAAEEKAIREQAKELGIKSWHIKSVDKLKEEISKEGA